MIPAEIREFLGLQKDSVRDYLYVSIPESATSSTEVDEWAQKNLAKAVKTYYHAGRIIYQVNQAGLAEMTDEYFNYIIDTASGTLSGKVCVAVEVNTSILSADVPVNYSPGNDTITEGEVTRQKTVEELMVCVEGTEGKSLILCSEKTNNGNGTGLQQEELLRFRTQFNTYYVFTDAMLATWKTNNIIEG